MATRAQIVDIVRSWVGTPYHHAARVRGVGADCGTLIISTFVEAEAIPDFDPGFYTRDWHLHRSEERYLGFVERYLSESWESARGLRAGTAALIPGQVLVWQVGRTFSHGAVVTGPDSFVHASHPAKCVEESAIRGSFLEPRRVKVFDFEGYES